MNVRRSLVLLSAILCGSLWFVPATATPASIAPGGNFTCGIDQIGVTRCWGHGYRFDIIGNLDRSAPIEVSRDFVVVDSGSNHACGLTAGGGVRCWGHNNDGQLGNGTKFKSFVPEDVIGLASGAQAISLGSRHSCALMQDGSVRCWGNNYYGQLGNGPSDDQTTPREVLALGAPVLAIAAGHRHTCALMSDHGMKCWGNNDHGQIGDGSDNDATVPVDVLIDNDIIAIAAGGFHNCALDDSGGAWCWGNNNSGEVGDGTTTDRALPVGVYDLGSGSGVRSITAGGNHSCALAAGFSPLCWGSNSSGQLGKGDYAESYIPVPVAPFGSQVTSIQAGGAHTCALDASGRPFCWGEDSSGQIGYGPTRYSSLDVLGPVRVSGLDSPAVQVSVLDDTGCAVTSKSGAMCWGDNFHGQIGDGSQDSNGNSIDQYGARDVVGLTNGVRQIAAGDQFACAVKQDGSVWCWGDNWSGQLGDGTNVKRITPVQVLGLDNVTAIDTGLHHACARTSAGAMYCWGSNFDGEIGDGTFEKRNVPVAVAGLDSGVAAIELGQRHSCALLDNAAVRCWGNNNNHQVGDGSSTDRNVPTAIDDTDSYAQISAGGYHSCGLTVTGVAKCWGSNYSGQIGDGNGDGDRPSPTPVHGLNTGVSLIAAGGEHSCAVQAGNLLCWGANNYYQLGDGTYVDQPLPEPITAISGTITAIELGMDQSCVLLATGEAKCFGSSRYGGLGTGIDRPLQSTPAEIARWSWSDHIFSGGFEL